MAVVASKPLVLFLCTANSARSQMAEALLRAKAGDRYAAASAGLEPAGVNPLTIRVLEEIGVSAHGLRSKHVSEFLGKAAVRTAIVVCARAQEACPRLFPFAGRMLHWPFDDPAAAADEGERLETFRRVRDEIALRLDEWLRDRAKD